MYAASLALFLPLIALEAHPPTESSAELIYRSAEVLHDAGRYAEAETVLREAITGIIEPPELLPALWRLLSSAHYNQGHITEAEKCLRSSLSAAERLFGRESIGALSITNLLSSFLIDTGRLGEAEEILRRALAAGEKLYKADHPVVVTLMDTLGAVLEKSGQKARAEPLFRRLLAVADKAKLDPHVTAGLHHNLGVLYAEDGRLATARREIEEAIAIWEGVVPADNLNVLVGQNSLVYVLSREGHLREAHDLARKTLATATSLFGPKHVLSLTALRNFSYVLARMGRSSEALTTMEQAIQLHEETYGSDSPIVAEILQAYAGVLRKVGRRQDAKQAERRAEAFRGRLELRRTSGGS